MKTVYLAAAAACLLSAGLARAESASRVNITQMGYNNSTVVNQNEAQTQSRVFIDQLGDRGSVEVAQGQGSVDTTADVVQGEGTSGAKATIIQTNGFHGRAQIEQINLAGGVSGGKATLRQDQRTVLGYANAANDALIEQWSSASTAVASIAQTGSGNTGVVHQDGATGEAALTQGGANNMGHISQIGASNTVRVSQGNANNERSDNAAAVHQSATSSSVTIDQFGYGAAAGVVQFGKSNRVDIYQSGASYVEVNQKGESNTISYTGRRGDRVANLVQGGSYNWIGVSQQ